MPQNDFKLIKNSDGIFDFAVENGVLATVYSFETALQLIIYGERRADESEIPSPIYRRGWWGNDILYEDGFQNGSKVWLLYQERRTRAVLSKALTYIRKATQWLIDDGHISDITISGDFLGTEGFRVTMDIITLDNQVISKYYDLWRNTVTLSGLSGLSGLSVSGGTELALNNLSNLIAHYSARDANDLITSGGFAQDFTSANSEAFISANTSELSADDPWTILLWVRMDNTSAAGVVSKWHSSTSWWMESNGGGKFELKAIDTVPTTKFIASPNSFTVGQWHLVRVWHDPILDQVGIQQDGGSKATVTLAGGIQAGSVPLVFGSLRGSDASIVVPMDGGLGPVAIYNQVISDATATSMYNSGISKDFSQLSSAEKVGLVHFYDMSESSGDILDSVGSLNLSPTPSRPNRIIGNGSSTALVGDPIREWKDLSSNNNHAIQTISGSQPSLLLFGGRQAVNFDGLDDRLPLDLSSLEGSSYTIMAAVARDDTNPNYVVGPSGGGTNKVATLGWITDSQGILAQGGNDLLGQVPGYSSKKIDILSAKLDISSGRKIFVNGVLLNSDSSTATIIAPINSSYIGFGFNEYFKGDVLELAIYDTALSDSDISANESALSSWSGGILGGFDFDFSSKISLTSPVALQVFQRDGSGNADIMINGTYTTTGTGSGPVEARFNGGAWTQISSNITNGNFNFLLTGQSQGQGAFEIRQTAIPTDTVTVLDVGIGDVIVNIGQSNQGESYTNAQTYTHATLKGTVFTLKTASGDWEDINNRSAYWPKYAQDYLDTQSIPMCFIDAHLGSASIADWQKTSITTSGDVFSGGTNLYTRMAAAITAANVGSNTSFLKFSWFQGTADSPATPESTYNSDLDQLVASLNADYGVKTIVQKMHQIYNNNGSVCTTPIAISNVNNAIDTAWGDNPNVVKGFDLSGLDADFDGFGCVHLKEDSDARTAGRGIYSAMRAAYLSTSNQFGASNDYFEIPDHADFRTNADFCYAGWFYHTENSTGIITSQYQDASGTRGMNIKLTGSDTSVEGTRDGELGTFQSSIGHTYALNTWNFLVVMWDQSSNLLRMSLNDGTIKDIVLSGNFQSNNGVPIHLGRNADNNGQQFKGKLAYWCYFKRMLTALERTELYNNGIGLEAKQVQNSTFMADVFAAWDFKEATGNLIDRIGSHDFTPSSPRPTLSTGIDHI